jgi:hypothetical protein
VLGFTPTLGQSGVATIGTSNFQIENSFESVRVHSLTLFCTFGNMSCDSRASPLAHTLVSPGLGHEPKAKIATFEDNLFLLFFWELYNYPTLDGLKEKNTRASKLAIGMSTVHQ